MFELHPKVHNAAYRMLDIAKCARVSYEVKAEFVSLLIRLSRKPPRVTINHYLLVDRSLLAQIIPSLASLWLVLTQLDVRVEKISFDDFFSFNMKH
jgi:hypothetical protein